MNVALLRQLLAQGSAPGVGGLWDTNRVGVASPQQGRPPLTGGLQQMQMLQAFRNGTSPMRLQHMNPYTPRPTQFLPPPVPFYSWANDPNNPANKPGGGDGGNLTPGGGVPQVGVDGPGNGANDGQDGGAAAGVAGGNDAAAGATGAGAGSGAK